MRLPPALLSPASRAEAFATVVALLAAGMFIGNWVIGPAVSTDVFDHSPLPSAARDRAAIDAMSRRPDPNPYRTPTPAYDVSNAPPYGLLARERALAAMGRRHTVRSTGVEVPEQARDDGGADDRDDYRSAPPPPPRYRAFDRHGVH